MQKLFSQAFFSFTGMDDALMTFSRYYGTDYFYLRFLMDFDPSRLDHLEISTPGTRLAPA